MRIPYVLCVIFLLSTFAAVQEDDPDLEIGEAHVESIDVLILESFPVQIRVVASGYFPDGCTSIHDHQQTVEGDEIIITLRTERPKGLMCTQALVPFEETIPVDTVGIEPGDYYVSINGVRSDNTVTVDATMSQPPSPGSGGSDNAGAGGISAFWASLFSLVHIIFAALLP